MVYSNFNVHLGIKENDIEQGEFMVVSDQSIDGNFLIHHFVSHYSKNNGCVTILGIAQTQAHYSNAVHKLGVSLPTMMKHERFTFIDGMSMLLDTDNGQNLLDPMAGDLKRLWQVILQDVESKTKSSDNHLFIIDDLTALINLGFTLQNLYDFIHYCKLLSERYRTSFLFLCHENEDDSDYKQLLARLSQYVTLKVHVSALKTGYSRDLSGEMQVTNLKSPFAVSKKTLHFKILDRDVRFFAPGTSNAVL